MPGSVPAPNQFLRFTFYVLRLHLFTQHASRITSSPPPIPPQPPHRVAHAMNLPALVLVKELDRDEVDGVAGAVERNEQLGFDLKAFSPEFHPTPGRQVHEAE